MPSPDLRLRTISASFRADFAETAYHHGYGLRRGEPCYVLDPMDEMGPHYLRQAFRVLPKNGIARYGEDRTRRSVLAAYDAQVAAGGYLRAEGCR